MEIKDLARVESQLKEEIDTIGQSPDRDKIAEEKAIPIIKQEIEVVMLKAVENFYYLIMGHTVSKMCCEECRNLRQVNTIEDCQYNLRELKKVMASFNSDIKDIFSGIKNDQNSITFRYIRSKQDFLSFLQNIISFVDNAVYITQMGKVKNDGAYVRLVAKTIPTMTQALANAGKYTTSWNLVSKGSKDVFEKVVVFFNETADVVKQFATEYLAEIKANKKAEEASLKDAAVVSRKVVAQANPQVEARLNLIKQANDKYEEFCLDFMRDLEKQYALSSRDLYENFINVRFKKFVERYPMPVPSSASEGYAKEVINQINILIEHVSKISQNSYVTSVYKEMQ